MECKISVIVPVYNVERYLGECLDSIINQTLEDIEIICINDGSKDSSGSILDEYRQKDSRIITINKTNGGYGAACNMGLRLAKGEFISIIEPDDFIDENMYKDMYGLAKQYNSQIVKSQYYDMIDTDERKITKIGWENEYPMPKSVFKLKDCTQLLFFHPSIWSCIYETKFLKDNKIEFVEAKGAGWVDNPFQIQTLALAKRIYYTDAAYYYYRLTNPTSSSNIVNISNPFDRTDEVHEFLRIKKINDKNILAHLYKREISYIHTVLEGIGEELFNFAFEKIKTLVSSMDEKIISTSKFINEYERGVWQMCHYSEGALSLMKRLQEKPERIEVVSY